MYLLTVFHCIGDNVLLFNDRFLELPDLAGGFFDRRISLLLSLVNLLSQRFCWRRFLSSLSLSVVKSYNS